MGDLMPLAPRDRIPELLMGKTIERVDMEPVAGADQGFIVVFVAGMRLYADAPALYCDSPLLKGAERASEH